MLVGRDGEVAQIDACLARARAGEASSLLLVGDPGLGKTALLDDAASHATELGMRVVRLTALELESGLPGSGLGILLPLLGGTTGPGGMSTLVDAMVQVSQNGPLLVVLDDIHWLDQQSMVAVSFAVRRLLADPVALLLASRTVDQIGAALSGVARIDLEPLSPTACREILRSQFPRMPNSTADKVADALGRVPLPLVEVGHLLTDETLAGRAPLPSPLPVGRAVRDRYARGFDELDGDSRVAVVLLSADDTADPTVLYEALRRLDLPASALDQAERIGLVRLWPGPSFVHPLARASVHSAATPAEQRRAHTALGEVWRSRGDTTRGLLHLAAGASGPDAQLAAELARLAAQRAATSLGRAEAAVLARLGGELASTPQVRENLLVMAAECSEGPQAVHLAELVLATATDVDRRARCTFILANEDYRLTPAQRVRLIADLDDVPLGPSVARQRDGHSVWTAMDAADVDRLDTVAARYRADDVDDSAWQLLGQLGMAFSFLGHNQQGVDLLRRAQSASCIVDPTHLAGDAVVDWATIPGWLGDDRDHHERFQQMDAVLRATGNPIATATAAFFSAERARREGDWVRAEALLRESIELNEASSQPSGAERARLASLLAYQGEESGTRQMIATANQEFEKWASPWNQAWLHQARGALALTVGHPLEVIRTLEPLRAQPYVGRGARDSLIAGLIDLVEAFVATGDIALAQSVTLDITRHLDGVADPFGPAMTARCRALASLGDADTEYSLALDHLGNTSEVFETARTQLLYGEHLRRTRRPREARVQLARAHEKFRQVRANPWAERARNELAAAGERVSEPGRTGIELTSQELRVAMAVTEGMTNAEVASALFISVKTVEFHLGHVYRKLTVRSRGGLAKALMAAVV